MAGKSSGKSPKHRGTLLIVDDEDGPRDSAKVVFKDDYDLLMADSGAAAIELVQKNKVDVALVDIRMKGMSGVEVLERIKYVDPTIEVIMMTAFETTDTEDRLIAAAATIGDMTAPVSGCRRPAARGTPIRL